jgi:hypothetical protein
VSNEGGRQVDDERVAFPFRVQKSVARPRSALHWAAEPSFLLTVLFEDGRTRVWECGSAA